MCRCECRCECMCRCVCVGVSVCFRCHIINYLAEEAITYTLAIYMHSLYIKQSIIIMY